MNEEALDGCAALVIALLVTIPLYLFNGWVLSVLWRWFITPTFGVAALSVAQGMGLVLVANFFTGKYNDKARDVDTATAGVLAVTTFSVLMGLMLLGVGAVLRLFM